jgi:DNA-binding NtrC family response regulator
MDLFKKLQQMRILLIDDDESIRDSLSLFFQGEGCDLLAVGTAEEGVEALMSGDFDIIISDYRLPGMDGVEFLKMIKETYPNMMRILITAYGNEELTSTASRMGIDDFIQKPLTTNAIEDSLASVIQRYEEKDRCRESGKNNPC